MYLNYKLVVSVVYLVFWVVGSNLTALHINFFFQIEETCTFVNISSLKYHLSVIVLPCVTFIREEGATADGI